MSSKNCKSRCECGECGQPSCCDTPYRICKCNKMALNIKPNPCILENCKYKELYCILYETILNNYLEVQLNNMYIEAAPNNCAADHAYNNFLTLVLNLFHINPENLFSPRLVITEQDGTVVIDTFASTNNTRANWRTKTINENHNSRLAILNSQLFQDGTGYETKLSTTTNTVQMYVAIRGGKFNDSFGTFRLSIDKCPNNDP